MARTGNFLLQALQNSSLTVRLFSSGSGSGHLNRSNLPAVSYEELSNADSKRGKAAAYVALRDRKAAAAEAQEDSANKPDGSYSELMPPGVVTDSAYEAMVERKIRESINSGALDKLKHAGQPLPHTHDAQFYKVDPLLSALSRSMGAQNIRPRSIDMRDELQERTEDFKYLLHRAANRLLRGPTATPMSSTQLPKLTRQEAERLAAELEGSSAGAALVEPFKQLQDALRVYNTAVLSDKETYGAGWPLHQRRVRPFREVCAELLQEDDEGAD